MMRLSSASLLNGLRSQADLLRNAAALGVGTVTSSVLGFVYWWIAARYLAPESVGLTAAGVSITSLIGLIAQLGLGTLLVGQSSVREENKRDLIAASLAVSLLSSLLFGALCMLIVLASRLDLGEITQLSAGTICFILGCGISGFALVLDNAFVGLLRSSLQMWQSAAFSGLKIVLLALALASLGSSVREGTLFATWVLAQAACVIAFWMILMRLIDQGRYLPNLSILRPHLRTALSHHLLDLVTLTPTLIMPFLVAVVLSPAINAAFNVAWMMLRMSFLVPAALVTVLFAVGQSDPDALAARIRMSLMLSMVAGVAVTIVFFLSSDLVLGLFNPAYPGIAGDSLSLMGISLLGIAIQAHYLTIRRLQNKMLAASRLFALAGLLQLSFAVLGGRLGGLLGLTAGWTVAVLLEAACMLPVVLQAANPRLRSITFGAAKPSRMGHAGFGKVGHHGTSTPALQRLPPER